ncbi:MAG: hypothetical protein AAGA29_12800 [Planctomycetota bacterium]
MPTPGPTRLGRGPSREMLGGPLLGVAAFLVVAVLLGWGLTKLFNLQLAGTVHQANEVEIDQGFEPDTVYILQRDLLLGHTTARELVLFPGRDDLPANAPNRRFVPTLAEYRNDPSKYEAIVAVIPASTRVQFIGLTIDSHNRQTDVHVRTHLLDGEHAGLHVTGQHLEQSGTSEAGHRRIEPRADLLIAEAPQADRDAPPPSAAPDEPIQSEAP